MTNLSQNESIAVALFSEIFMTDQLSRSMVSKALPKGMELSHFSVLNHLAHSEEERSPAQLARAFNLTRGAITNTLTKLEWAGHIHVRPDWDDARRKFVSISPSGAAARNAALAALAPMLSEIVDALGLDRVKAALPLLRDIRMHLESQK